MSTRFGGPVRANGFSVYAQKNVDPVFFLPPTPKIICCFWSGMKTRILPEVVFDFCSNKNDPTLYHSVPIWVEGEILETTNIYIG
jgi:hypothetical protein